MTNSRRSLRLFALCTLPGLAACGGGGAPGGGSTGAGNFRATIDGQAWVADASTTQVTGSATTPGALTISGTRVVSAANYQSLTLALGYIDGPRTYPLGVNQGTNAGGSATISDLMGSAIGTWMTDFSGARGTLTVTSMTAARFAGTFEFTAPPQIGSTLTNTRTVTDGHFDLPVPSVFQPPAADDTGSVVTATVNGEPWNGATVVGLGDTAVGALSFGGTTTGINLSFVTSMPVQAGMTYDQTGVRLSASNNSGGSWTGSTSVSAVTVTSLSATRIAGTFTATLQPAGSTASPLVITAGTFDVKILPAG